METIVKSVASKRDRVRPKGLSRWKGIETQIVLSVSAMCFVRKDFPVGRELKRSFGHDYINIEYVRKDFPVGRELKPEVFLRRTSHFSLPSERTFPLEGN